MNFRDVAKRIQHVIGIIQKHDSEERFSKLGAKVEFGEATFIDEHSLCLNGKTYSVKNWDIATGSSPSVLLINGLDKTPYITNRQIFSLEKLAKSMIILGGGPIGTEMAQSFARLGTEVAVIQRPGVTKKNSREDTANAAFICATFSSTCLTDTGHISFITHLLLCLPLFLLG